MLLAKDFGSIGQLSVERSVLVLVVVLVFDFSASFRGRRRGGFTNRQYPNTSKDFLSFHALGAISSLSTRVALRSCDHGEAPVPQPDRGEMLIRVHAVGVTPTEMNDWFAEGPPRNDPMQYWMAGKNGYGKLLIAIAGQETAS